ncbi:MAG: metalloregulator ArsR/SmtB family transcription factor [Caldilineaceae bacterium]|nr:metalloregulator ArsR/SmtB family transcription factor [Caldilineaceae bacterium]
MIQPSQANHSLEFLKLLAHEVRWSLLLLLRNGDYRVNELVTLLDRPMNLVSYHLKLLRSQALVKERRSSADGRDVYYSLDLEKIGALFVEAEESIHPGLVSNGEVLNEHGGDPLRVLFLCTHNSARSQMAEGLLNHLSNGRVEAYSAGSQPGTVHPLAVQVLAERQIDIGHQRSKHMQAYVGQHFDYIITVCDRVREECPVFPDDPERVHWSFPDPTEVKGSEEARRQAFADVARDLTTRINYLLLIINRKYDRQKRTA